MAYITEWFKVIQGDALVGVATDQEFARYSEKSGRVHICKAIEGEYVLINDKFYHDDWMLPINPKSYLEYENATVLSISEKEYDILIDPTADHSVPAEPEKDISEMKSEQAIPQAQVVTIDFVRERKLKELSAVCNLTIENGFSLVLSDEATHHFSLKHEDQINLMDLQMAFNANDELVYHADGELMQYYSREDAQDILIGAKKWKSYNLALYNSLKNWINSLTDIEVIESITYDSEIPDEYCTVVFQMMTENF